MAIWFDFTYQDCIDLNRFSAFWLKSCSDLNQELYGTADVERHNMEEGVAHTTLRRPKRWTSNLIRKVQGKSGQAGDSVVRSKPFCQSITKYPSSEQK